MQINEGQLTLTHTQVVARDTLQLRFSVSLLDAVTTALPFQPGQFLSMEFGPKAWRAYSIASHPSEDQIELLVRMVEGGVASEIFREAEIGQVFNFKGPFGHFVLSENQEATLNFCATGTGIAPLRAMILEEAAQSNPRPMRLFYGGRNTDDIAYLDQIKNWSSDIETFLGLSRSDENYPKAKKQRITSFLEDFDFTADDEFYLCGSGPMVKSVNQTLATKNIPKEQIFQERFN